MTNERLRHVQAVFDEALKLAPQERPSFIQETCKDDPALRAEVESLLSHLDSAGDGFMRATAPAASMHQPSADPALATRVGTIVAGCYIKSVIAAGGMGTVYFAEQDSPRRPVAIKIMHAHVASRDALRRFQFESQALARLRHPNIARVYLAGMHRPEQRSDGADVGPTVALPYFVMEYIPDAKTLPDYAEQQRLSIRDRLALFVKVCDAVHHGHQKGVIHRDIKPANVLVDAAGEPKIIDFGIARSTDADMAITTQVTRLGQLIGTLQYMSPEQCDGKPGEIDTRSDVYSLGVVLFELLTGRVPYDVSHMTLQSAARLICEQAPAVPSSLDRHLRGDLDTIILKALDKNRDNRYPSAESLAFDVRRHLRGESIAARPPTGWARAVRWVIRHPIIVSAVASITVALTVIAATFVAVWFLNSRPSESVWVRAQLEPASHPATTDE